MDGSWLPESLYIGLQGLEDILNEVGTLLRDDQHPAANSEDPLTSEAGESILVENHASVINGTHLVIQELRQITMACINQGKAGLSIPPLDPMLHEWISECSANVLRIKSFIGALQETNNHNVVDESNSFGDEWLFIEMTDGDKEAPGGENSNNSSFRAEEGDPLESVKGRSSDEIRLGLEFTSLKDRTASIVDFIPILKSQFDEFLSGNVSNTLFPDSTDSSSGDGSYSFQAALAQRTSLGNLRRLLYNLSDEIKLCRAHVESLAPSLILPINIAADSNDLKATADISIKILAELLSNNASEWIDSMLAGKLSFQEFSTLDQEELQEFVQDLQEMNEQLRNAIREMEVGCVGEMDVPVIERIDFGICAQRVKGLNWMLGWRELT